MSILGTALSSAVGIGSSIYGKGYNSSNRAQSFSSQLYLLLFLYFLDLKNGVTIFVMA